MARKYVPVPWPLETRENYRDIYNELLRAEAMLEACLAEDEMGNPYLYEPLLPKVMSRFLVIYRMANEVLLFKPEGQGPPPKWVNITKKVIRLSGVIAEVLDASEITYSIRAERWLEVAGQTKSILQASRYLRKKLVSVPLEKSRIVFTKAGFREMVLVTIK